MKTTTLIALLAAAPAIPALGQDAPYAGQQARAIAALSAEDVEDLLAGRGWGLAKPAELNGWPGPSHVLELADDLGLSDEQRAKVTSIFADMRSRARSVGADYIAAEAALDAAFATGDIDSNTLVELTSESAALEAELRTVHLAAHIATAPLLTRHQKMTYARLRGYSGGSELSGHGDHEEVPR